MSVKNFKFVSPGVFINEIDNSFIPKSPDAIGPVVIGRATRGLALQPIKVESYSDFVEMFGDTVPGGGNGDVSRDGNFQSPMYGTYAAKAFLNAGIAPLTYIRLLGEQSSTSNTGDAAAGWKTTVNANNNPTSNGGAYGLWVFSSGSDAILGTGSLAAIWEVYNGAQIYLSGTVRGGTIGRSLASEAFSTTGACGVPIGTDSDNLFTLYISGATAGPKTVRFGFDDSSDTFVRKRFNTNPQFCSTPGTFFAVASQQDYWLGASFEQELRDASLVGVATQAVLLPIAKGSDVTVGPQNMLAQATKEGRTGWFIGQDLGAPGSYVPFRQQKLFRLLGRGHGEWLQRNCKVSIEKVRQSTTTTTDYGTFSLVIRQILDTDNNVVVMERFDNLTLDPTSPDYIARRIGDTYTSWDSVERRLKTYGEYPSKSKFVYVDVNADVDAGATDATLLPFGYFGPPRFRTVYDLNSTGACSKTALGGGTSTDGSTLSSFFLTGGTSTPALGGVGDVFMSGGAGANGLVATRAGSCTGTFPFPSVRLRTSASAGGLSEVTNAYYGMDVTRATGSSRADPSVADVHKILYANIGDVGGGTSPTNRYGTTGVEGFSYVFSLDDIVLKSGTTTDWYYSSGSRARENSYTSASYKNLLNASINRFTAPIWGGFDGFNVIKPDPMYNKGMGSTDTETTNYIYYTWKRAVDTVADPEFVDMNLLATPGLTHDSLTTHAINVCERRADSLALIDLANVYLPPHEQYYASKSSRIATTPASAASALKDRIIDSSYGATFYPWVQTRDETTGQLVWIPPSIAMMGVLASSEKRSELWFAPAGFNRGGLTEGAAGIPITNVTERLVSRDRDTLYEAAINPIASFPSSGIVVFGQKTLQERRSALDRINVRRLVIFLKKRISILSTQILFEQNVQSTWNRFIGLIDPLLANVKARFGLTDYRLILDESTTTPDLIDQNILYAKIMIKPARAIEYIAIDFVIMSTGASFDD